MRDIRIAMVVALLGYSAATALTRPYAVEPVTTVWSGWTHRNDTVAQTVTCCWDSLSAPSYVELFAGAIANGGLYNLDVRDDVSGDPAAHKYNVHQSRDHSWVRFDTLVIDGPFVKGRRYRFEFRRQGQDSIQYYWQETPNNPSGQGPYLYGIMTVGGQATAV